MCTHSPQCPDAESATRTLAVVVAEHHEQGWALLCNGVIHFDDDIDLLPNGDTAPPVLNAA
jgi:hypothetical protein